MKVLFKKLAQYIPLSHEVLIELRYTHHVCGYYCAPFPADGAIYRLELQATIFDGNKPRKGTEEWRAYIINDDSSTIRRFKTIGELNYFHKGMVGSWLF